MVMCYCSCGWIGSGFELAARASGAVNGEDGHLVIFVSDKPEKEPETKMQCPECGLDFDKMAEWMNKNIDIEDII